MTKIPCLFGFHTFEYEESVLTGKRYKVCRHCGVNHEAELIALVFLIIYVGVVMNGF